MRLRPSAFPVIISAAITDFLLAISSNKNTKPFMARERESAAAFCSSHFPSCLTSTDCCPLLESRFLVRISSVGSCDAFEGMFFLQQRRREETLRPYPPVSSSCMVSAAADRQRGSKRNLDLKPAQSILTDYAEAITSLSSGGLGSRRNGVWSVQRLE